MLRQLCVVCFFTAIAVNQLDAKNTLHKLRSNRQLPSPTLTRVLSGNGGIRSIVVFNDELYVRYRNNQTDIAVYDTTSFELQRRIIIPDTSARIYDLAISPSENSLYVSDYRRQKIFKVRLTGSRTIDKWEYDGISPMGLSVNRQGNLLATTLENVIHEWTPSGSLVREISIGKIKCSLMLDVVELNDGTLAFSCMGRVDAVIQIALNGTVLRSSPPGQVGIPTNLAVHSEGYILVADVESRILVVNPTLTEVRVLPLSVDGGIGEVLSLCLDESRGRLYVGEALYQERVLVFDNVSNLGALFAN